MGCSLPAQLVSLNDGPSILLDKPILLVGRHPECDIQIESRKVSRRHCCIAQVNDYLVVRDLGSTNGIRINGVRVLEGQLKFSDELTIGGSRFRLTWEVAPEFPFQAERHSNGAIFSAEDKQLESCDEPVALPEPDGAPKNIPVGIPHGAHPLKPLIPEALELAPCSDLDVDQNAQPK